MFEDLTSLVDWSSKPGPVDLLGVLGILFAGFQLWKSRSAMTAARESYEETRSSLTMAQLLAALPDLTAASQNLDDVLHQSNPQAAAKPLRDFSQKSLRLAALIEIASPTSRSTIRDLKRVANETSQAQSSLYDEVGDGLTNQDRVGKSAQTMRSLVAELHGLAATLQNTPIHVSKK